MVGPRRWRIGISFTKVGRSVMLFVDCCVIIVWRYFILLFQFNTFIIVFTVDEHYSGNRSRNAIVRQDLPTAKVEQEREIREAEERYGAFIKEQ